MRILAVSDEESQMLYRTDFTDPSQVVDLVIGCGDLSYTYMDYLVTQLRTPFAYFVHGNHDHPVTLENGNIMEEPLGWMDIDQRSFMVKEHDLIIAGLEGCVRYRPRVKYQYSQREMRVRAQSLVLQLLLNRVRYKRYMDIFIAHSPMRGVHDSEELAHKGFIVFRSLVQRYKPRLFLHGHTHHYALEPWRSRFAYTDVVNVYPFKYIHFKPDGIQIERFGCGKRLD